MSHYSNVPFNFGDDSEFSSRMIVRNLHPHFYFVHRYNITLYQLTTVNGQYVKITYALQSTKKIKV